MAKNIEDWRKAGHAAHTALVYGASLIKPGVKYSDVSDAIEIKIKELGADLAFPVNISVNSAAAHDVPYAVENRVFTTEDLIKLDVGAEFNGAIGDNAMTIDLTGKYEKLSRAAREALQAAIKLVKPGTKARELGKAIETAITSHGFQPVRNLSGHSIEEYTVHAGFIVPNYDDGTEDKLEEGMVIAIEPFATDGVGLIGEASNAEIFSVTGKKPLRSQTAREALKWLDERNGLPTSTRWLSQKMGSLKATLGMKEMNQVGMLHLYPPLVEVKKGMVAQWENTLLVTKDGCEILTK